IVEKTLKTQQPVAISLDFSPEAKPRLLELSLVLGCAFLHLLSSVTGRRLYNDSGWLFQRSLKVPPPLKFPMTVTPLGRDQDCSLKNREPDVPASWFLDPGGWSKTAAVSLYFIFPGICTLSLEREKEDEELEK
ncbi:hypothetical protein STEG23_013197, partial [Scotinomys teguina]